MYIVHVRTLFFLADSDQSADVEEEASLKAQVNQPPSHIRHTRYIRTQAYHNVCDYNNHYISPGREFRALFLSTSEPTDANCSTKNPTKSLCDRYVFNTALTRAQSLVVSVGNPFLLLKMEQHMVDRYKEKGKCWSHYLKRCLDHNTLTVPTVPQRQQEHVLQQLRQLVDERLGIAYLEPRIQPAMEPQVLAMEPLSLTELAVGRAARPPTRAHDAPPLVTRSRAKVKAKASARLQQQQQQQQQQPPSPNQPRTDSGTCELEVG